MILCEAHGRGEESSVEMVVCYAKRYGVCCGEHLSRGTIRSEPLNPPPPICA